MLQHRPQVKICIYVHPAFTQCTRVSARGRPLRISQHAGLSDTRKKKRVFARVGKKRVFAPMVKTRVFALTAENEGLCPIFCLCLHTQLYIITSMCYFFVVFMPAALDLCVFWGNIYISQGSAAHSLKKLQL